MALERIVIQNFQSLKKVDIELGKFTVITGASSSGKSAFMRALRGLASNVKGTSAITVGEKSLAITAYTDKSIVTLQKTGATGKYLVVDRETGEEEKYTKLAQKVPEDVSSALRIQPVTKDQASINFAGQHDLPYLLGETSGQVARVLGDLTNVSTIFEAVREANRKKSAVSSLLKTRQADLDSIREQAQEFTRLRERIGIVEASEKLLDETSQLSESLLRLEEATASLERSEALLARHVALPPAPSLDELEEAERRFSEIRASVVAWASSQKTLTVALEKLEQAKQAEAIAHQNFHAKLAEVGTCPTCGQEVN